MTPGTEIGMHIEVALAIAGEPLCIRMPEIWGVRLAEQLPPWTSAKDIRHSALVRRSRLTPCMPGAKVQ